MQPVKPFFDLFLDSNLIHLKARTSTLENLSDKLSNDGYAVLDDFLPISDFKKILVRFEELKQEEEFNKAGIGKQISYEIDKAVRGDFIRWIDENDHTAPTAPLFNFIQQLVEHLNRTCFIGIKDFESHYAFYPPGRGYATHRDRFKNNAHRLISFVFYLNNSWKQADGGYLMLYNEALETIKKIEPIGNRIAFFMSETLHEVTECHEERRSITGWLLDQPKGVTFINL